MQTLLIYSENIMKIILMVTLVLGVFSIQKSSAYGEENWNPNGGTCWHFDIRQLNADLVYFGRPLANGFCPGVAPSSMHSHSSTSTASSVSSNKNASTTSAAFHDTEFCGTLLKPPRVM